MGGNAITTKRATDLASEMATGLLEPITSQIDPLRLGEDERKIEIARKYGKRLLPENRSEEIVLRFTDDYPSHGFVIDLTEAREIFGKDIVTSVGEEERSFENYWPSVRGELSEPFLDFHTLQSLTPIPPSSHAEATEQQQRQVSDEETPGDVEPDSTRQEQNAPADNIEPDSGDRDKTKREEQSPGERKSEPSVRRESDVEPSSAGEDDDQNGNNSTETEDE